MHTYRMLLYCTVLYYKTLLYCTRCDTILVYQVLGDHIVQRNLPLAELKGFHASLARGPKPDGSIVMVSEASSPPGTGRF